MSLQSSDLVSLFEQALQGESFPAMHEIGVVVQIGDGICKIHGLTHVELNELVRFDGGNSGIVFQIGEDTISVFVFERGIPVIERELVRRTGSIYKVSVGFGLLGRVVNAQGQPIDGRPPIKVRRALSD